MSLSLQRIPYLSNFDELFKVEKVLGEGQFGKVLLVRDQTNDDLLALKIFLVEKLIQERKVSEILREVYFLERTDYPTLVKYYDNFRLNTEQIFDTNEYAGILMEYFDGYSLQQLMNENTIKGEVVPPDQLRKLAFELLHTLKYLHSNHIVHNDLKLDNVLFNNQQLKVVDMGLSCYYPKKYAIRKKYSCRSYGGAEDIQPPEITEKRVVLDVDWNKVDMFGLGVVLYQIATNQNPWDGVWEVYRENMEKYPPKPFEYNDEKLKKLILLLLSKNPNQRPSPDQGLEMITQTKSIEIKKFKRVAFVGHRSIGDTIYNPKKFNIHSRYLEGEGRVRNDYMTYLYLKEIVSPEVQLDFVDAVYIPRKAHQYDLIIMDLVGLPFLYNKTPKTRFGQMLLKFSHKIYPNNRVREVLNDKCEMYDYFSKRGVVVSPFECVVLGTANTYQAYNRGVKNMIEAAHKIGGEGDVVIKPAFGFMETAVEVLSPYDEEGIADYVEQALSEKDGKSVVQKYIPSFSEHFEMRNYFIGGEFQFALFTERTKTEVIRVTNETEAIEAGVGDLFRRGNKLAHQVMDNAADLYSTRFIPGLVRIDIGCCLDGDKQVFFNETELLPGMFFPWFDGKLDHLILQRLAQNYNAVINKALNIN